MEVAAVDNTNVTHRSKAADWPNARAAAEGRVVTYPGSEVVVGAERSGRIVRLAVEGNNVVRRGDLLAELESDELRATFPNSPWWGGESFWIRRRL